MSLIDVVRAGAHRTPQRLAVISAQEQVDYAALLERSEALARGLAQRQVGRFGIAGAEPIDIISLLIASSATGSEACVYPRDLDHTGVASFAERFDHDLVVCDAADELPGRTVVSIEALRASSGQPLGPAPADGGVMILTTGTTGTPKGVRHEWARLMGAVHGSDADAGERWLLAYNLNQFAGSQVLLHALVRGSTLVVPRSPRARDAIDAMRSFQVTHASGTPTFWRLLVGEQASREVDDRPPLRQITLGGEASPPDLLERLHEEFPGAQISHIYAGTEFGSAISVRDGLSGLPLSVLQRDDPSAVQFKVVDGELYVRSPTAMLGYHGQEEAAPEWIATGDLVEQRGDRLHFVGRVTEIINVGGAKVHPLPVEEVISGVPGVLAAVVYGQPNPVTGMIVAADVVLTPGALAEEVEQAIRAAAGELPPPGRPRRIRFVDALRTRGNKALRTGAGS